MPETAFKDLRIDGGHLHSRHGDGGPVAGAVARIESGRDLYRRMLAVDRAATHGPVGDSGPVGCAPDGRTSAGLPLTGIGADGSPVYLSIEAPGWSLVRRCALSELATARQFAEEVTTAGSATPAHAVWA